MRFLSKWEAKVTSFAIFNNFPCQPMHNPSKHIVLLVKHFAKTIKSHLSIKSAFIVALSVTSLWMTCLKNIHSFILHETWILQKKKPKKKQKTKNKPKQNKQKNTKEFYSQQREIIARPCMPLTFTYWCDRMILNVRMRHIYSYCLTRKLTVTSCL